MYALTWIARREFYLRGKGDRYRTGRSERLFSNFLGCHDWPSHPEIPPLFYFCHNRGMNKQPALESARPSARIGRPAAALLESPALPARHRWIAWPKNASDSSPRSHSKRRDDSTAASHFCPQGRIKSPRDNRDRAGRGRARWAGSDTRTPPTRCRPAAADSGPSRASRAPGSSRANPAGSGPGR
jgi:hypothetical protein